MKLICSILLLSLLSSAYAQEGESYLFKKERPMTWYADMDLGTTISGGFVFGGDVQAIYKKNVFALFTTNGIVRMNVGLYFNLFYGKNGLIISTDDLNSFQVGFGYGRVFEHNRFQLSGYVGPSFLDMKSGNKWTLYGSVSPTWMIRPRLNIGLNLYGMITNQVPPGGVLIRTRFLLNNERQYLNKVQRENLPQ